MCSSELSTDKNYFHEEIKNSPVRIETYLKRIILRTHHEDDTGALASIFSNRIAMKHLPFLQPPNGWTDQQKHRVNVQNGTRANGKSCVLNIILLDSKLNEKNEKCIGSTGYVTIDGNIGYLGIITDPNTTRMGYATEALHTAIRFAFEKLGINTIIMLTDEQNQEMRGWCENTAGLTLYDKKQMQMNDYTFTECQYRFTIDQWKNYIKKKLENKMDQFNKI